MIPGPFTYHRPADVAAALAVLASNDEARVIAGGHSLVPLMKMRMASIDHLVDLQAIPELRGIEVASGGCRIGAMVTQAELIAHAGLRSAAPILAEAALQIADPQVRNMGTIGGNVANGDPGNDMPAVMQCLDATFELRGPGGSREVAARDYYEGAYQTARRDDEILVAIRFAASGGYAYEKQKRKIGDFATAAAAVMLRKEGGRCAAASIAMTNLADTPVWAGASGAALVGTTADGAAVEAAVAAMQAAISPSGDSRGPAEFKRHVAATVLRRAIARAWSRA